MRWSCSKLLSGEISVVVPVGWRALLGRHTVEPSVVILAAKEGRRESLRSWEVLIGHVCCGGHLRSVAHRRGRVKSIADLEGWIRPLDFFSLGRELTWHNVLLFDRTHILFDLGVNLSIQFTLLA